MPKSKAVEVYSGRITEQYLLDQINYHYDSESFRDHKNRMEEGDLLYRGHLNRLFPSEQAVPDVPYVENKFKNALHDLSRLASEGRGSVKAIPRGDRDRDMKAARIHESINEGYWTINRMRGQERRLYLDLAGSGMMALTSYYDDTSPYPKIRRLDPRFCWPDVANGELQDMLYVQEVKERIAARTFPELNLDPDPARSDSVLLICYYDSEEVVEAVVTKNNERPAEVYVQQRWVHKLDRVPVAFEMLDTYDGAFHGLFEQLGGPLMVRNKTVRFMVDYLESIAHSPIVAKGVVNGYGGDLDEPGPKTVYQLDENVEGAMIGRLAPAAPAGTVFGLLQYMQDQEEKEALQPPARSGNVSQSIASGSFVDRTQGQLTSVVKELQDKMTSLREQVDASCMRIDEVWMNKSKPLVRPVSGKNEYKPSEDIAGWYFHEVKFGAGAGLDRLSTDARVQNHIAARLISREEGRAEIDYLDDSASSQDKIDRENLQDALMQRFVTDPATPPSILASTWLAMKMKGKSFEEALEEVVPEMVEAEKAQRPQQPGGELGPAGPVEPGAEAAAAAEPLPVRLPAPTVQQLFGPGRS